jgi:lactate dehydrogenase-like 2-hydroxyacid dehydrogenase
MKPAVLVTMQLPPAAMSRLEQHAAVTTVLDQSDPRFAAALAGAEGMLINPRTRIDRELFARAPKLRAVSTYSVGLDHIDLAAAEQRGVAVGHTPVLTDAVALDNSAPADPGRTPAL